MGRVRKQPTKPIATVSKGSPIKRKRGRPCKKKLVAPSQVKEIVTKCSVCLDTTRYRKMKALLCNHAFHEQCINKWLETNKLCPLCRMPTERQEVKKVKSDVNVSNVGDEVTFFGLALMIRRDSLGAIDGARVMMRRFIY